MNKLRLSIIDDDWEIRKEVYQNVLEADFMLFPISKPAELKKSLHESNVDGYIIDIILDKWTTEKGEPQELIPILNNLKGKEVPIILISRNYDTLLNKDQLTKTINAIIEMGLPVKSFMAWSDFERENRYLKDDIINRTVQDGIKLCLLSNKKVMSSKKEKEADVGIICALNEELIPFLDNFKEEDLKRESSDNIHYKKGSIETRNGKIVKFVTVLQQEMGTVDAASIGAILVKEFNIKHLFMIGVCGGRGGKVKIGDIIIPTDSVAYQRGKITENGLSLEVGHSQTNVSSKMIFDNCNRIISTIFKKYSNRRVDRGEIGLAVTIPNIHFDPMACGENVLDKSDELDRISENVAQRKLCAIDMESYALLRLHKFLNIKTVVIKSVMDLTNDKSDDYKGYAAYIAANFLLEVLKEEIYEID